MASSFSSWSPFSYGFNNPVRFIDPDGRAPDDIILRGSNNSSITIQTDIIDIDVDASSFIGDVGGNHVVGGNDAIITGLDVVGMVDPTPISDGISATLSAQEGDYLGAGASVLGAALPLVGDAAKIPKIAKGIKKIVDKITTSKAARRQAMRDAGIPTSQSLIPDKATKSQDKVFLTRDGKHTVQDAKNDISHQGQPHWEAGPTKRDLNRPDGLNRSGSKNNKPQMGKPKSKAYYEP